MNLQSPATFLHKPMKPIDRRPISDSAPSNPEVFDPLKKIADALKGAICATTPPLGPGDPTDSIFRQAKAAAMGCTPPPDAPNQDSPSLPIAGGKCPERLYRVRARGTYEAALIGGGWETKNLEAGTSGIVGAITGIYYKQQPGSRTYYAIEAVGSSSSPEGREVVLFGTVAPQVGFIRNVKVSIEVVPEDPDAGPCPVPERPTFPPSPPRNSPTSPPPIVFPPSIRVEVAPDVEVELDLDVNIDINGDINFRIGDSIDVNVNYNDNSFDFYLNPDSGIDIYPDAPSPGFDLPPGRGGEPTGNGGKSGEKETQCCRDLKEILDRLKECACDEPNDPNDIESIVFASANNRVVTLPKDTQFVRLILTDIPDAPKQEWGGGDAPDVYYAGWTSFGIEEGRLERQPIDFLNKCFVPPAGATTFAYTCRRFYSAALQVSFRSPSPS